MAVKTSLERCYAWRARQAAAGIKPIQIWVPDTPQDQALIRVQAKRLVDRHMRERAARSEGQRASKMQADDGEG